MENELKLIALQEESNKLLFAIREKYEDLEKSRVTKGDLDTFRAKVDVRLDEIDKAVADIKRPDLRGAIEDVGAKEMKEFRGWIAKSRELGIAALAGTPPEQKVLTIADSTHSGVLAPYEYVNEIIKKITLFSPLRDIANIRQTSAYAVEFPTETAIGAATYVAESVEKTETTGFTHALIEIPTFEMKILYKATQKMLEDSRFNLEAEIAQAVGRGFGVLEATSFYNGNGTTAPEGVITNSTVLADARNVITDNTLAFDDFIGTQYQLADIYAKNAAWVMNRSTLGVCVGLKSATTNTYLLQHNLQAGQPTMILGSPVYQWAEFPALTAATGIPDAQMILGYGDFRAGYTIVDRVELYLQRLIEKYAEFGMIGFLARKRHGGAVTLPEAIQLLKNMTS